MKAYGIGLAFLRVVVGAVFFMHGARKLFVEGLANVAHLMGTAGIPLPFAAAIAVAVLELVGGGLLVVGLLTRITCLLLVIEMAVAVARVHLRGGFFLPGGFEYALTLLAANVALLLAGPGVLSFDNKVLKRRA